MRILVTGVTGQVALPIARALAREHEVFGLARFRKPAERERVEAAGVRPVAGDFVAGRFDEVPRDVEQVLNFAVAKTGDFDRDLAANAEGLGLLMAHCRGARALLHCSSTAVYQPAGREPLAESAPLGDSHRGFLPTYSICKIAAEAMARFCARQLQIPTTIARLNVPYGDGGGWPAIHLEQILAGSPILVSPDAPHVYNPIHEDDLVGMLPRLVEVASVPATIVNWAGSRVAGLEEWCGFLGELVAREPRFAVSDRALGSVVCDTTRMHQLVGETRVDWRDGVRRMVRARHPELALRD
jgi:nucleoside-diphosphate-sugar epimerase